jgi:hypothetical protein
MFQQFLGFIQIFENLFRLRYPRLKMSETKAENSEMNIQRLNIRYLRNYYTIYWQVRGEWIESGRNLLRV